jgi:hypothetical protein
LFAGSEVAAMRSKRSFDDGGLCVVLGSDVHGGNRGFRATDRHEIHGTADRKTFWCGGVIPWMGSSTTIEGAGMPDSARVSACSAINHTTRTEY